MRRSPLATSSLLALAALCGCAAAVRPPEPPRAPGPPRATIRRTAYGIPHITALDYRGLGAGIGYAQAEDAVCALADQILKVRGERARYLGRGPGDAFVESDLTYRGLGLRARAEAAYGQLSPDLRELLDGYAAGYDHYLARTPRERLPAPCTGAAWVKPIAGADLLAYHLDVSLGDTLVPLLGYVSRAQPPGAAPGPSPHAALPRSREPGLGSNGWAIGRERSAGGGGMLVANPHFPWEGALRFHESHLTIPGKLDVYGAALLGMPAINIGFNRHVAWTHTVTASSHFTAYRLRLAEGDPTAYVYDGQVRRMTSQEAVVEVLEAGGTLGQVKRTFWRSHYGPILSGPGVPWNDQVAYTVRDANEGNVRFAEAWLRMDAARSLDELAEAERAVRGIPWVNTIMAGSDGSARFVDASRVPLLSPEAVAAYRASLQSEADARMLAGLNVILLDGSTSRDEWVGLEGPSGGLVPVERAPQLSRADFVMNANDPATYTNPDAPLVDLPFPYATYGTPQGRISPRTHMNLALLAERGEGSAAGADGRFTLEELEAAILSNRSWVAEQLRAPVVQRCQGAKAVKVDGAEVDLAGACRALASWDGRLDLDRPGAVVWRELLGRYDRADLVDQGPLFAAPFDPLAPMKTPSGLAPAPASGPDPLLQKLGEAVAVLHKAGIDPGARLGDVQRAQRGGRAIPIHGGISLEGVANVVGYADPGSTLMPKTERGPVLSPATGLTQQGYPVNNGSTFILVVELAERGPRAAAVLTYSESSDPASPHFSDQTGLFSNKQLRPALFEEADILADPALATTQVEVAPGGGAP